ncbi:MAG TPA: glycosyltransferase, partial [Polyangiaceae bacterium]|nr:glycosyltransferase [Polyangiaceae bacterium]
MRRVLFVTWDGPGQSYLPSLFFPIFSGLAAHGYRVDVLQHTTATQTSADATAAAAASAGVSYVAHLVSPRWGRAGLPAVVVRGAVSLVRVAREQKIEALFPRSLIPAAMALLACRMAPELRLIFDADGLMADERVDFTGLDPRSPFYRILRDVEAEAVRRSTAVITRTTRARSILGARAGAGTSEAKSFVVPNGKDAVLFAPRDAESCAAVRAARGIGPSTPWLVYVGALGPQYFPEAMLSIAAKVRERRPDARFTLFTRHAAAAAVALRGADVTGVEVDELAPERVPEVLAAADLGIALRATTFSQTAVSP